MENKTEHPENDDNKTHFEYKNIGHEDFTKKSGNIMDEFLLAGIYGDEGYLSYIDEIEEEKNTIIENELKSHKDNKELERSIINRLDSEISEQKEAFKNLSDKHNDVIGFIDRIKNELPPLYAQFTRLKKTLYGKRKGYRNQLLEKRINSYTDLNSKLTERLVDEEAKKLEYEEKLFEISEQRYKKNEKEYNRRVSLFEAKRKLLEDKFREFDKYIDVLRKFGITRTSSGFLIWSSYLGFAAFGWFIGEMIIKKLNPSNSFVSLFASAIKELVHDKWTGVFVAIFLPLLIVLIYTLLLFCSKNLQQYFNPYKDKRIKRNKPEVNRKNLLNIFFTKPNTDNTDYSNIISKLPLIYFWTIIPLIIAVVLPSNFDSDLALNYTPMDNAIFTYFGIVLSVVFSGFVLVYSLKVIEPRIFTKILDPSKKVEKIKSNVFLVLNIEIVITLALILIGFVIISIGEIVNPEINFWGKNNSIIIILLLLLCSFVLSYGIIYRGMFREHTALKRTLYLYEKEIEKYCIMPVLEVDKSIYNKYASELDSLQIEVDKIWDIDDLWKSPGVLSNKLFENLSGFFNFNSIYNRKKIDDPLDKLINADFVFENDLTVELLDSIEKIKRLEIELNDKQTELNVIESDKRVIAFKMTDLNEKIELMNRKILDIDEKMNEKIMNLREYYENLKIGLKNAYNVGKGLKAIRKIK